MLSPLDCPQSNRAVGVAVLCSSQVVPSFLKPTPPKNGGPGKRIYPLRGARRGERERSVLVPMKIFLIRHATPNWHRTDIPYDIFPGPLLTPQGEKEAEALAAYLKSEAVVKLYHSPFVRAAKTAQIISAINHIPCVEEPRLAEWRMQGETELQVRRRMKAIFDASLTEAAGMGSIGLVSHGGPIGALLEELGIDPNELAVYRTRFDTTNPLPPAAAWQVERKDGKNSSWNFSLGFIPSLS
jgi:broad specificity phosphatase PhoE